MLTHSLIGRNSMIGEYSTSDELPPQGDLHNQRETDLAAPPSSTRRPAPARSFMRGYVMARESMSSLERPGARSSAPAGGTGLRGSGSPGGGWTGRFRMVAGSQQYWLRLRPGPCPPNASDQDLGTRRRPVRFSRAVTCKSRWRSAFGSIFTIESTSASGRIHTTMSATIAITVS